VKEKPEARSIVFVVDDDASVREAISSLLRSVGLQVEAFGTAAEFLQNKSPDITACRYWISDYPGSAGLIFK
jgi:FixJ family two-component response regulator